MTRRTFDQGQLSGPDLVKLMHGLARMPRYTPNTSWLAALAAATQHQLQELTPGGSQEAPCVVFVCMQCHVFDHHMLALYHTLLPHRSLHACEWNPLSQVEQG